MKVLVIKLNPFLREGITNVIMNLYRAMDKRDMQMDMVGVFEPGQEYIEEFEANGGKIFVLNRSGRHLLQYINSLRKRIKEGQYDVVHVHGNSATMALEMVAAWLAGCKVRIAHSHNTTCKSMAVHRLLTPIFRALCTHRLACGDAAGKWLYGNKEFTVVNNGIDTARFVFSQEARQQIRKQYAFVDDQVVIGHVGIFNEAKNQSFLIDILSCLDEKYRLLLIGDGHLRKTVEEKAAAMGLANRVTFAGVTDRVPDYLSACDLIVMPSLYEGLPLALVEQQTNGLQCIVSDNITREADKTGNLIFLPLSAGAQHWADVVQVLQLPENREEASRKATEQIKCCGYDISTEAQRLRAYYFQEKGE